MELREYSACARVRGDDDDDKRDFANCRCLTFLIAPPDATATCCTGEGG